eukprot:7390925-Prymnesium_polylepis.2
MHVHLHVPMRHGGMVIKRYGLYGLDVKRLETEIGIRREWAVLCVAREKFMVTRSSFHRIGAEIAGSREPRPPRASDSSALLSSDTLQTSAV